ncbi:MAG: hypothetical protein KAH31_04180 [Candidatus Sabulitectum sp.]|nr:hypothetical protein [Candidatus Sabulitectum sp.]
MISCVLLLVLGTSTLPVETTAAVTEIDSMVQNCLDQDILYPARHFLGTMKPVQGPGIKSWEVFIFEETEYELLDDDMLMSQRHYRMDCLFNHADYEIFTSFFFDIEENPVLCISTWRTENGHSLLYEDRFYFSEGTIIACSSDGASLRLPSDEDTQKGLDRLGYAQYVLNQIMNEPPGTPPVLFEQIEYIYAEF